MPKTILESRKSGGKHPLRNGHFIWSVEAFKRAFKVGDIICGGASITGKITAIGQKRFLFTVTWGGNVRERVGMIESYTGWGKPGWRRI